ncbi:MAG: divergent polysaccharide deacetylase family protein [Clostridiales bacterium]|nr:divergent polysaccharide deacetylase family protein [Clostridiales bacterium]
MKVKYRLNMGLAAAVILASLVINSVRTASEAVMSENTRVYIAVVIDDFGGSGEGREEMFSLPVKFTGAVMPFMENSKTDAARLIAGGNDVLIHLPMEAKTGKKSWLGEKPLLTGMGDDEIKALLEEALAGDYAVGVNNHMGSKATEDERIMSLLFETLSEKGLIFVDSMTTAQSKSEALGEKYNVTVIKRDVFLDSTDSKAEVIKNLEKTRDIAKEKGYALCIGHVGAEGGTITAAAIAEVYKNFEAEGIEFVTVSRLKEIIWG